jgi:hypothetical protein
MLMNLSSRVIRFKEKTKVKTTTLGIYISWQTSVDAKDKYVIFSPESV